MKDLDRRPMNVLSLDGNLETAHPMTELHFPDGRTVRLPTAMLADPGSVTSIVEDSSLVDETTVVPVLEERLEVSKRTVPTGKVLVEKTVEAYDVQVDELLAVSDWKVERVSLKQVVETLPKVRQEGETTIYPLVEEQLVVTKQLVLVEEVRVTRIDSKRRDPQTVTLRREHVSIKREPSATK